MAINDTITEIRWHGRGGQGAKTASLLFAEIMLRTGNYYVQAFPEYGPERMGAPVQAFNRISRQVITIHSSITSPDYIVVLDPSLLEDYNIIINGFTINSKIIINTSLSVTDIALKLNINKNNVYVVNAREISLKTIGKYIPNAPMLGALLKIIGNINLNQALNSVEKKLLEKFRNKTEVIHGNLNAISSAFNEVSR
ncbi:MAG: 2-oxoacid:acceptor oxidoreductase family protein [Endomicrobium sp.]|jgi:pyruvate ferredoxin oxidoreductase gamma subunit|nr:2-oxoacid:acceptor oxidoreductase family protein [Endomicrobium sp.]